MEALDARVAHTPADSLDNTAPTAIQGAAAYCQAAAGGFLCAEEAFAVLKVNAVPSGTQDSVILGPPDPTENRTASTGAPDYRRGPAYEKT